jgi:indole-3-glycerol phosphate synthase
VSANDVIDGAQMGASTVLLIVAALSDEELTLFHSVAQRCGIDALVEVHDQDEARRAVDLGARIIGVNQRDLRTFDVGSDGSALVIGSLPENIVTVCESGLNSREDVARARDAGFDAVLVGESFVRSADPAAAVRSFASVTKSHRG